MEKKTQYSMTFNVNNQQELLEFLLTHVKNQSRNNIKSMLKNHCVLVDGVVTTQYNYILSQRQIVQIAKTPVLKSKNEPTVHLDIIYEDDEFVVINKPAGLLSIATEKESNATAYHYLNEYIRKSNPRGQIFIVHRLDKDTSGVLMMAKNPSIRDTLQDKWNEIVKVREYYAVVENPFTQLKGTYKSYLAETKTHIVFSSKGKEGKLAITDYEVIKQDKKYALVRVNLHSGRKNQIRVQMAENNHPVLGDNKYGEASNPLKRLGLHASILEFVHPINGKTYRFEAKMPSEFKKIIKN